MEKEAFKEYFSRTRNKISLAVWLLLNNNIVSPSLWYLFQCFDFVISLLLVLSLYDTVGSITDLNAIISTLIDFQDANILAVVSFVIVAIMLFLSGFTCFCVFKDLKLETYSAKACLPQIASFLTVVMTKPFFVVVCLLVIDSLFTFQDISNIYVKYVSAISTITSCALLSTTVYLCAHLFKIPLPNDDLIPWSDTTPQPTLLQAVSKLLLALTAKLRFKSIISVYILLTISLAFLGLRVFHLHFRTHTMNNTSLSLSVIFDSALLHYMFFFLVTAVVQGQSSYFIFVSVFLPVTCLGGMYIQRRAKRDLLSKLMNEENMTNQEELLQCYLYLIHLCEDESDSQELSHQYLIRLQQVHYTRCEPYFERVLKKMHLAYNEVERVRRNMETLKTEELLQLNEAGGQIQSEQHSQQQQYLPEIGGGDGPACVQINQQLLKNGFYDSFNLTGLNTTYSMIKLMDNKRNPQAGIPQFPLIDQTTTFLSNRQSLTGYIGGEAQATGNIPPSAAAPNSSEQTKDQQLSPQKRSHVPPEVIASNFTWEKKQVGQEVLDQEVDDKSKTEQQLLSALEASQMNPQNKNIENDDLCVINVHNETFLNDIKRRSVQEKELNRMITTAKKAENDYKFEVMAGLTSAYNSAVANSGWGANGCEGFNDFKGGNLFPEDTPAFKPEPMFGDKQRMLTQKQAKKNKLTQYAQSVLKNSGPNENFGGLAKDAMISKKKSMSSSADDKKKHSSAQFKSAIQISEIFTNTQLQQQAEERLQRDDLAQEASRKQVQQRMLQQRNSYDFEKRRLQLKKLAIHFFNSHLGGQPTTSSQFELDFMCAFVKVYFTVHVLKNPYLAQFLMFSLLDKGNDDGQEDRYMDFITVNQKLISKKYLDELIKQRQEVEEEQQTGIRSYIGQIDLKNMLVLNQLMLDFDSTMEALTSDIQQYWDNLLNQREIKDIFAQGIKISDMLSRLVTELLPSIEKRQSDRESRIYLQMAQFYSQVVFKANECALMMEKARMAFQAKKIQKLRGDREVNPAATTSAAGGGAESVLNASSSISGNSALEKCMVMTDINLKKPMRIMLMNKQAMKVTQYLQSDMSTLSINQLMPRFIAECHQQYIDEFLLSGKTRFLRRRRELFIRQKSGCVAPVLTYLAVNNITRKHMILIFEENVPTMKIFTDEQQPQGYGAYAFLLANQQFKLGEVSQNFFQVTGVSPQALKTLSKNMDRNLEIEDFVKLRNYDNCEVSALQSTYDTQEAHITFENVMVYDPRYMFGSAMMSHNGMRMPSKDQIGGMPAELGVSCKNNIPFSSFQETPTLQPGGGIPMAQPGKQQQQQQESQVLSPRLINLQMQQRFQNVTEPQLFQMRIVDVKFMQDKHNIYLIAFRRMHRNSSSVFTGSGSSSQPFAFYPPPKNIIYNMPKPQLMISEGGTDEDFQVTAGMMQLAGYNESYSSGGIKAMFYEQDMEIVDQHDLYMSVGSQSSTGSNGSTTSTALSLLSQFASQLNKGSSPKTLKFILNMVLIIILVMIGASTMILSLSLSNLLYAEAAVYESRFSLEALQELTSMRLLFRSLANIHLGYLSNNSQFVGQRVTQYEEMLHLLNEKVLTDSNELEAQIDVNSAFGGVQCGFISEIGSVYSQKQNLPKGLNLFFSRVENLLATLGHDQAISQSVYPYFNLNQIYGSQNAQRQTPMTLTHSERDLFFILNNSNGELYKRMTDFGPYFTQGKIDMIESKLLYLSTTSLSVSVLIFLSLFAIIPLFGKIQNRILELMKLFFAIDPEVKQKIVDKIVQFQHATFKHDSDRAIRGGRTGKKLTAIGGGGPHMNLSGRSGSVMTGGISVQGQQPQIMFNVARGSADSQIIEDSTFMKNLNSSVPKNKPFSDSRARRGTAAAAVVGKAFNLGKQNMRNASAAEKYKVEDVIEEEEDEEQQKNKKKGKQQGKKKKNILSSHSDTEEKDDGKSAAVANVSSEKKDLKKESGESSDEEKQEKKKKKRKSKKHKRQDSIREMEKAREKSQTIKEQEYLSEFVKFTQRRKISQSVFIAAMLTIMSSFFIIMYLLSSTSFAKIESAMDDLSTIFNRVQCSLNVINTFTESYTSTQPKLSQDYFNDYLDPQMDTCLRLEAKYLERMMQSPEAYLENVQTSLNLLETGQTCSNDTLISVEQCMGMTEQIRKQGLATYFFDIIRTIQQMRLEVVDKIKKGLVTVQFISGQLNSKISSYIDTLTLAIVPAQSKVESDVVDSIINYFGDQRRIYSTIFALYICITVAFALYFFGNVYRRVRKEMLQSNYLLYIIDFEGLDEMQRGVIHRFLVNY